MGTGNREQGTGKGGSSELALQPLTVDPIAKIVCQIPLVDGTEYAVTERDVEEWRLAYPAVDIPQQLHAMRAWCNANKAQRKTRNGVTRFITRWLGKAQDEGGRGPAARGRASSVLEQNKAAREEMLRELREEAP